LRMFLPVAPVRALIDEIDASAARIPRSGHEDGPGPDWRSPTNRIKSRSLTHRVGNTTKTLPWESQPNQARPRPSSSASTPGILPRNAR
jgi:hypothetical protein